MRYLNFFIVTIIVFFLLFSQKSVDHMKLGDQYLRAGKISFAREEYKKALSSGANGEAVAERMKKLDFMLKEDKMHFAAAEEFDRNGDFESAAAEYRIALRIDPSNIRAMQNLMADLFRLGRNEEGFEVIGRLTALGVESPDRSYHMALYYYRKEKFELASENIKKCLLLDKKHGPATELAVSVAKKLAEAKNKKLLVARELFVDGIRKMRAREFKTASAMFADSIASCLPGDAGDIPANVLHRRTPLIEEYTRCAVYFNLAVSCESRGAFEEAIAALEKLNEAKPGKDVVFFKIAENYARAGDENNAYQAFLKTEKINSSFPEIHARLGFSSKKLGKYEEAIAHFANAARYDPQNPLNYYNLAIMYKKTEKLAEALETFNRSLALTAGDSNLRYLIMEQLGLVESKLKNQSARN